MKRYGKLFDSGYWLDAQWWYPEEDFMQLGESYDAQGIAYNAIAADNAKKVENFYNLTKQHEKLLAARDLAALASATLREESIAKNDRIRALEADLARCRAANVYDGNAHRKVAEVEVALQRIAAYSPGLTPIPGDPIEIARTALETACDSDSNKAGTAPSDAGYQAPTPRGSLPNSLGTTKGESGG